MRTTLDIDDDVLQAAKERARHEGSTAGKVISDLARRALTVVSDDARVRSAKSVCGFRPFPKRGSVVTNELVDRLRDDDAY
jgi:hypothetical protein